VHAYWLAVRRSESPELPESRECFVVMTRQNYRVRVHELSAGQYRLLEMLNGDRTVAEAIQQASGLEITTVQDWLCQWTAKGFFENLGV